MSDRPRNILVLTHLSPVDIVPTAIRYLEYNGKRQPAKFQVDATRAFLELAPRDYDREMVATVILGLVITVPSVRTNVWKWVERASKEPKLDDLEAAIRAIMRPDATPKILSILHGDGPSKSHFSYQTLAEEFVSHAILGDPEICDAVDELLRSLS